jgi:carbohydrate kinase (thermoresistant glucokinase family)
MQRGALTDADRWPWLDRVAEDYCAKEGRSFLVIACSALKRSYRDRLRDADAQLFCIPERLKPCQHASGRDGAISCLLPH